MAFLLPHITGRPQISNIDPTQEETGESSGEESNISSPPPTPMSSSSSTPASRNKIKKYRQVPPPNVAEVMKNYLATKDLNRKKEEKTQ
nr:unnamed protein product [Callosobruchus analis]